VYYTTSCNTQSSTPEDGRDHLPKHVELVGIINKPLVLHLVGVYIIYINDAKSNIKFTDFPFMTDVESDHEATWRLHTTVGRCGVIFSEKCSPAG